MVTDHLDSRDVNQLPHESAYFLPPSDPRFSEMPNPGGGVFGHGLGGGVGVAPDAMVKAYR